ncbi:MAG: IS110 family transposase [Sandaracinus sp.]|nr:IS110 family transposase [Sandaracinus sp.]
MRFVGIDIGSEKHVVAIVDEAGKPLRKPTPFSEDDLGYQQLRSLLGDPSDAFVAMEATGHYWQNLFAFLHTEGFAVVLLNPTRTARFAAEDLRRAKTDALDALGIARFAQQRNGPRPLRSRTKPHSSFASSCVCVIVSCKTSGTALGRCTARST